MQRLLRLGVIAIISAQALTGCAYLKGKKAIIKSQDMAYLETHEVAPLQVPSDLHAAPLTDDLLIPTAAAQWTGKPPSLLPPQSLADRIVSGNVNAAVLKAPVKVSANKAEGKGLSGVDQTQMTATEITLAQDFEQSWGSLGNAIPAAGYKTLNENKAIGRYFIADLPGTGGKLIRETEIYQLQITSKGDSSIITITDNLEQPVIPAIAKRVLSDIQKGLQAKPKSWWSR